MKGKFLITLSIMLLFIMHLAVPANALMNPNQFVATASPGDTVTELITIDTSGYVSFIGTNLTLDAIVGPYESWVNPVLVDSSFGPNEVFFDNQVTIEIPNDALPGIYEFYIDATYIDVFGPREPVTGDRQHVIITVFEEVVEKTVEADIDVKPGSSPNSINLKSNGVLPIAILGSADFDVTDIDPDSVSLINENLTPTHWAYEDDNEDGYMNMIFHFNMKEVKKFIEPGDYEVMLMCMTYDGLAIQGSDSIRTVPKTK